MKFIANNIAQQHTQSTKHKARTQTLSVEYLTKKKKAMAMAKNILFFFMQKTTKYKSSEF
jgi:hypothetical protein